MTKKLILNSQWTITFNEPRDCPFFDENNEFCKVSQYIGLSGYCSWYWKNPPEWCPLEDAE